MSDPLEASYAACRRLTQETAGNFYWSFHGLPYDQHRAMCALYAFMRRTDDIGDEPDSDVATRRERLREWEQALKSTIAGEPTDDTLLPAMADVVSRFEIPVEYLDAVIAGVRSDLSSVRIETFADLETYCYRVAGVVGLCCIHIWGFEDERALKAAVDCGTAFQLTNILRDVAEDARMGRVYLPATELAEFGVSPDEFLVPDGSENFRKLMQYQIDRARGYYERATPLIDWLAPQGRPILRAMIRLYGGLLDAIERDPQRVLTSRVELPRWRKLSIGLRALLQQRFGM